MNKIHLIKTLSLASLGGLLVAGLIVFIISKYDNYSDWLFIKQSLWLGLFVGLFLGIGYEFYQTKRNTPLSVVTPPTFDTSLQHRWPNTSSASSPQKITPQKKTSIWGFIWRSSLASILGLIIGFVGGVWYCVESFSNLSSLQQDWGILYFPGFVILVIITAGLGLGAGTLLGILWAFLK